MEPGHGENRRGRHGARNVRAGRKQAGVGNLCDAWEHKPKSVHLSYEPAEPSESNIQTNPTVAGRTTATGPATRRERLLGQSEFHCSRSVRRECFDGRQWLVAQS